MTRIGPNVMRWEDALSPFPKDPNTKWLILGFLGLTILGIVCGGR